MLVGGSSLVFGVGDTCKHRDIQSFWSYLSALFFDVGVARAGDC